MSLKQKIEIILKIVIVFLSVLLLLSLLNGGVTLYMIAGALGATYIFIYYWRRKIIILRQKKIQVK